MTDPEALARGVAAQDRGTAGDLRLDRATSDRLAQLPPARDRGRPRPQAPWYTRREPWRLTPDEYERLNREPLWGNVAGVPLGLFWAVERVLEDIKSIPELPAALMALVETLTSPEFLTDREAQLRLIREIALAPLREIYDDFEKALEAVERDEQMISSAHLVSAVTRILGLLASLARTLRAVPAAARKLRTVRSRLARSRGVAELKRLLRDEAGSLRLGIWRRLARLRLDIDDDFTRRHIASMYELARRERQSNDLMTMRARFGELRTAVRFGRDEDVFRVRFLKPSNVKGERTPDLEILFTDRGRPPRFVEVRTFTQAPRGAQVPARRAPRRRRRIRSRELRRKIEHGQVSGRRPGIVVFHETFAGRQAGEQALARWQRLLSFLPDRARPGLEAVEVSTGGGLLLRFAPPSWRGRILSR